MKKIILSFLLSLPFVCFSQEYSGDATAFLSKEIIGTWYLQLKPYSSSDDTITTYKVYSVPSNEI